MPARSSLRVPKSTFYKPRNCAVVRINSKRIYLGKFNSPASKAQYDKIVREWLANQTPPDPRDDNTIVDVIAK